MPPSTTVNRRWAGLAPTSLIAGDFHSVFVFAMSPTDGDYRIAASEAYLPAEGSVQHYDRVMRDVRALESFPEVSRLAAGPNDISLSAFGFTGPGVFDLIATFGSEYKAATKPASVVVLASLRSSMVRVLIG